MTVTRGNLRLELHIPDSFRLQTERLDIVAGNAELAQTDWQERQTLSELLEVNVPDQWPPELVTDSDSPDCAGWWDWYVIERNQRVLIGMAGLKGWLAVTGDVQTGCAFLPQFQGKGYGTEAVSGLTSWVLEQPQVNRVIAETLIGNGAAASILRKLGFAQCGSDEEQGLLQFEKTRP